MITNAAASAEKLKRFFMNELTQLEVPELTRLNSNLYNYLIINNSNLQTINLPYLEQNPYILLGDDLREINLDSMQAIITTFGNRQGLANSSEYVRFLSNSKLQSLTLPSLRGTLDTTTSGSATSALANNYWLRYVDFGNETMTQNAAYYFGYDWFANNYFLEALVLRYPYVLTMAQQVEGLNTSALATGNGGIYVPEALIDGYKVANGWGSFEARIKSIENDLPNYSTNTDTITDSWETIIANCNAHQVNSYPVGGTKTIVINGMPTQMRIVKKNADHLTTSDSYGDTAALTWLENTISRFYLVDTRSSGSSYSSATALQTELNDLYLNIENETLRNNIKSVEKLCRKNGGAIEQISAKIWIPSPYEITQNSSGESLNDLFSVKYLGELESGPIYYLGLTRRTPNTNNLVALRSWSTTSAPDCLNNSGAMVEGSVGNNSHYLIIGFCT